ncbi:DUF6069 family protein [Streptomyces sp. cg28]|uniref:DUF6069 family protein n=1 Tax=Streptomyces sp. cg28 TaxID=3403457 RepID=UPI003B221E8E
MDSPNGPYGPSNSSYRVPQPAREQVPPTQARLDAGRLWAGGVMTAVVAALTAIVALLLVRGVLGIAVFAPEGDGAMGNATTGALAGSAALAALAATGLLHLLMAATPRPDRFFNWILTLATAVMVLLPFTTTASLSAKCGTAAVYLLIGVAIGTLLSSVARSATRRA